jgi:hypothetical protein
LEEQKKRKSEKEDRKKEKTKKWSGECFSKSV